MEHTKGNNISLAFRKLGLDLGVSRRSLRDGCPMDACSLIRGIQGAGCDIYINTTISSGRLFLVGLGIIDMISKECLFCFLRC